MNKNVWYRLRIGLLAVISVGLLSMEVWAKDYCGLHPLSSEGIEQSPIDIKADEVTFDEELSVLRFKYESGVKLDVENNGETVKANVPKGTGKLRTEGNKYKLIQFHWHVPSEHLLEGDAFSLEMHLVHQANDGTLLVVGVWIVTGAEHKELDKILSRLPEEEGQHVDVKHFNLRKLLPENLASYRYGGSLTTEPFTEDVRWVVLAEPVEMSEEQIQAFMELFPEGNAREVQPLNGRIVQTDVELEGDDDI